MTGNIRDRRLEGKLGEGTLIRAENFVRHSVWRFSVSLRLRGATPS